MVRPCRRGRAQYLPKAKTVSGERFFFGAHLSLGGIVLWMLVGWCFFGFKLGFSGVLRQIPSESVGAIHESPASKLEFIDVFG